MKNIISFTFAVLVVIVLISCNDKPKQELTDTIKSGLRADAKNFMESLKSILVREMQTNGIISAALVCSDTAQILTNNYGITKGIFIRRVSEKYRNPNNKPDDFEIKALDYFQRLKFEGKLNDKTEYSEIVEENDAEIVRYMKPIILQAPCLSCHGDINIIPPDVKKILNQKYPDDQAIGYQIDELRGAVSIKKTL